MSNSIRFTKRNPKAQREATRWNNLHKVGTPVVYESIKGETNTQKRAKTIGEAFVADSGVAVIFVEGVCGYVALDHIRDRDYPYCFTRAT